MGATIDKKPSEWTIVTFDNKGKLLKFGFAKNQEKNQLKTSAKNQEKN